MTLSFIGYGPVQFRIAEALCILPFFFPFSIWGLFTGCIIANLISPYPLDIAVGSTASLLAAACTMQIGIKARSAVAKATQKARDGIAAKALACAPPVLINAVFIGALIAYYMVGAGETDAFVSAFVVSGLHVGFGQLVVLYLIGLPLLVYLPKSKVFAKLSEYYGN